MTTADVPVAVLIDDDVPTRPVSKPTTGDRIYRTAAAAAAAVSLIVVGLTAVFLVTKSADAIESSGIVDFFTTSVWNPTIGRFGVAGLLAGTVIIAAVAMTIGVPLGVAMALFINEYVPPWLRGTLTSLVDLLAALPSIIFGIWGAYALVSHINPVATWLSTHLAILPFFEVRDGHDIGRSSFLAGVVVGIMILPIVTSISRDVMAQVPREQCEGALALGGTRWAMVREVILPFARGGIIGAALLGFGRALGETIAVALLVVPAIEANSHILEQGSGSIASHIALRFGEATSLEQSGLVAAGLALFILAFVVNFLARLIVRRAAYTSA